MSITCQNIIDGGQQKRCGHCPPRAFNPAGKKAIMKADMYMNQTMKRGGGNQARKHTTRSSPGVREGFL